MHQDSYKIMDGNIYMKRILNDIHLNLSAMNEYYLVETLVLIRKLKHLDFHYDGLIDYILNDLIILIDSYSSLNAKIAAQIFHEFSLLNIPTKKVFEMLKNIINDDSQHPYITGYSLSLIIKACGLEYLKNKQRFYAEFCYQSLNLLEKHLRNFQLSMICRLFKNICLMRLNLVTIHRRVHPCLLKIKGIIQEKREDFQEKDVLCLLEAFIYAPVTFDNELLLYLKSSTLYTIETQPENLTLKFLIKFVELMAQQSKDIRLNENSLEFVGKEILKRFKQSENIKFSLIFDCLKAYEKNFYCFAPLFNYLYKRVIETPENNMQINLTIQMVKIFLKLKFDCTELMILLREKAIKQKLTTFASDKLLDLMYIYTHPSRKISHDVKGFNEELLETTRKILETKKKEINSFLFYLANEYLNIKNELFLEVQSIAYDLMEKNWEELKTSRKFDLALFFINSKHPKNKWQSFLFEKTSNLDEKNLSILLHQYNRKESKDYCSFDLVLKALIANSKQNRDKILKQIFDVFARTPPFKVVNHNGKPNQNIYPLIDLIEFKNIDLLKSNISLTEVLKFARFFEVLEMDTDFIWPIFFKAWKNGELIKKFQEGDIILIEIGEFLAKSFLLSRNFHKVRIEKKLNKYSDFETKTFNEDSSLSEKVDEAFKNKLDSFRNLLIISNKIFQKSKEYFEKNFDGKVLTLSWLSKFLRIYMLLFSYMPELDKSMALKLFSKIKERIIERKIDNRGNVIKALFGLIELELIGVKYENHEKEFIKASLKVFQILILIF